MRKLFRTVVFIYFCSLSHAFAQEETIRLIIRSDDMGFSHAANQAIMETYEKGITTSVELMVPTPWFPEAVQLLNKHPELDVGIHITLTSEWKNLKWRPLTQARSLTDTDGYFYPMIWPNDPYGPEQALKAQDWSLGEIEQEMRAQIEMALRHIPRISHLSAHMGCISIAPEVAEVYRKLAKEYNLNIHPEDMNVGRASYAGPKETAEQKKESFINMLKALKPGTHLFVDHPAYDVPEVQAIYHTGYEDVAIDRQGVTDTLTDPEIIQLIKELKIELISYVDLKKLAQ